MMNRCDCTHPERAGETPDDAALCVYCGGIIPMNARDLCDLCGHDADAHDRRGEDGTCESCAGPCRVYNPDPDSIATTADVRAWFDRLHRAGLSFHPDDSAWRNGEVTYGSRMPGGVWTPCMTPDEARGYDAAMDKAWAVCEDAGADIYQTGLDSLDALED